MQPATIFEKHILPSTTSLPLC